MTDPELVQRRQERAYTIASYAPTRKFIEDPADSDDEEEDDDEEDDAEEEEAVDEEIQVDVDPNRAIAATTDADTVATETAVDDPAKTMADITTETPVPPTDTGTSGTAA